ncbi:hypothetical protein MUK42_33816 [Musa troglodytarum]|uniref:Uncharacterized protein n=1 Tax=Musa troglodytarum TaxID=320322 RepID=A0A9E7G3J4_9LILI|nr:hypothetical protein MUK42_33816 [Musa troglodytarum]
MCLWSLYKKHMVHFVDMQSIFGIVQSIAPLVLFLLHSCGICCGNLYGFTLISSRRYHTSN